MIALYIALAALLIALIIIVAAFFCYKTAFYANPKKQTDYTFSDSEEYAPYKNHFEKMIKAVNDLPFEDVYAISYDGLKLHGKLYTPHGNTAPVQIMFHGYRSRADVDFCGGLKTALTLGYNVLLVDQRAHGKSQGNCITFGINERFDCLIWANYIAKTFGKKIKCVLYGMSMGAATVLMSADLNLPENVAAIVADCGYSSPADIIKKVIKDKHLPRFPCYSLVRLGGKIFGKFDLQSAGAKQSMQKCTKPVLFIHGAADSFVPCDMSRENYANCISADKKLLIVPNAAHGISYMVDTKTYLKTLTEFLNNVLPENKIF